LGVIIFIICNQKFGFETKESIKDTILLNQEKDIVYSGIDHLFQKYKNTEPTKYKHNIFDKIYILEKNK